MKDSTSYYACITQHFFELILFLLCHLPLLHSSMLYFNIIDLALLLNQNKRSVQALPVAECLYFGEKLMLIVA